jgi:hypothetical protein
MSKGESSRFSRFGLELTILKYFAKRKVQEQVVAAAEVEELLALARQVVQ